MNLFFDTSALVKFFHEEEGTETVTDLILDRNNHVWILELATLEFKSSVFRRFRNREITEEQLEQALTSFDNQLADFNVESLGRAVLDEADSLLKEYGKTHGLRTLDALHLGTFSLISEEHDWFFVASDNNLCDITKAIGFEVINPLED
jgi:predicted nucleic acid-binding protein